MIRKNWKGGTVRISLASNHQKGWALRSLREAKAELTAAKAMPYIAPSLVFEALRKAQAAIYFSLGDPEFIAAIIYRNVQGNRPIEEPVLRFLVEIERTIQQMARVSNTDNMQAHERVTNKVEEIIQFASEIVGLFTN